MDQATLWILGITISVHVLLASVSMFFLYKDHDIGTRTKVVHGLLAWLVPFVGCAFSINSIFGISGSKNHQASVNNDAYSDGAYQDFGSGNSGGCDGGE
ncbi:hypothetical protein [Marinicella rhabdoformis]|uniref:hypothetical protein n=1 Tax=Marinicella rhabdoformis TaxID=2580566 RepID=UPI0012AED1E1|nr:hypothetical protein [Marinicella rhabdoformis]